MSGPSFSVLTSWAAVVGDVVCPTSCGGCGGPGEVVCNECGHRWWRERLQGTSRQSGTAAGVPVWSFAPYGGPWKRVLGRYKDGDRRDLIPLLAQTLAVAVAECVGYAAQQTSLVVIPVPSTASRTRQRGDWPWGEVCAQTVSLLDQHGGVASQLSLALRSGPGALDQDDLSAAQRWRNRQQGFVAVHAPPGDVRCVLVDDVTTTGATLTAAVECLHAAGWVVADAVTVARVRAGGASGMRDGP